MVARTTPGLDRAVTIALQSVASLPLDLVASADTFIGQSSVTLVVALVIAAVLWRRERGGAWLAAGFLALVVVGEVAFKFTLDHPSPPQIFVRSLWNPLGVHVSSPSSFPSGHVARVTFLAILLSGVTGSRLVRALAVIVVGWTLWARVYIGDHWVSDVFGALALGAAAGFAALAWLARCRAQRRRVDG